MSCNPMSGGSENPPGAPPKKPNNPPPGAPETPEKGKGTGGPKTPQGGRRITRKAHWRYIRGMKIRFPSRKVRDMGSRGKWASKHGPGIGKLEEGTMMGYSPSSSKTARHKAIRKAVKRHGALSTFRKLNALSTYTKRTAKSKSKVAKVDRNWVKKTFM